jgi:hypothetical protein
MDERVISGPLRVELGRLAAVAAPPGRRRRASSTGTASPSPRRARPGLAGHPPTGLPAAPSPPSLSPGPGGLPTPYTSDARPDRTASHVTCSGDASPRSRHAATGSRSGHARQLYIQRLRASGFGDEDILAWQDSDLPGEAFGR